MKFIKNRLFVIFIVLVSHTQAQQLVEAGEAAENISVDYFNKNLSYLASDELKGRNTGSDEYALAAEFVAQSFKENGLQPFGDEGTYFQTVPFIEGSIDIPSFNFEFTKTSTITKAEYGENISVFINPFLEEFSSSHDLVFVGYGNILPDQNINDYENLDVKGKTVVICLGGPKGLKNKYLENPFVKISNATRRGANGVILYSDRGMFKDKVFESMHGFVSRPRIVMADTSISRPWFRMDIVSFAKKDLIAELMKINTLNLNKLHSRMKKGEFVSQSLTVSLECSYKINQRNKDCKNVVALLPGSHPELKNEYIVLGAHLDHVGVGKTVKGDSIYNGMWDNATGVAATMSIAKAFNDAKIKPDRSIIFISYTGEEKGLYGSKYFVNKTHLKSEQIVANQNIDMLGSIIDTKDITPIGYSHSNLSEAVDFAARQLNLEVGEAEKMERMYIERSDQASFIKIGTPVLYMCGGVDAVDPKVDTEKEIEKWMDKTYHSPFDDLEQEYSEEAFLSAIKVNFLTLYYIANHMDKIEWNKEEWLFKKYLAGK